MKIVILDKMTLGDDIYLSPLYKLNAELDIFDSTKPDEVEERIINADVVIVNKIKLGENNLSAASKLKLICVAATGYDNEFLRFSQHFPLQCSGVFNRKRCTANRRYGSLSCNAFRRLPRFCKFG